MRVLLGLAALAVSVSAQSAQPVTVGNVNIAGATLANQYRGAGTPTNAALSANGRAAAVDTGATGFAVGPSEIRVTTGGAFAVVGATGYVAFSNAAVVGLNGNGVIAQATDRVNQQFFTTTVSGGTAFVYIQMNYNTLVSEVQYQTSQGRSVFSTQCDPCSPNCAINSNLGPTSAQRDANVCAALTGRVFSIALATGLTQFQITFYDYINANSPSTYFSQSFAITRPAVVLVGDPQIVGMQGQDFQVHGMPDEIFNMVTYPNVQVNARFTYLSQAECPDNYTACFAHPGTYISEQGLRVGKDKVRVVAGPAKKGLTVHVNGKKVHQKVTQLKLGSVQIVNHRRVVVKTPIAALTMTNSDNFMNQEINMFDEKLLALGADRKVLKAGESFHPEVPLHGLQGQTWRNVEHASGLEYEGSIMDYHVVDGNLFGTDFVFNKFDL